MAHKISLTTVKIICRIDETEIGYKSGLLEKTNRISFVWKYVTANLKSESQKPYRLFTVISFQYNSVVFTCMWLSKAASAVASDRGIIIPYYLRLYVVLSPSLLESTFRFPLAIWSVLYPLIFCMSSAINQDEFLLFLILLSCSRFLFPIKGW